jgi:DNA-binding transcriptional LysR family regulator
LVEDLLEDQIELIFGNSWAVPLGTDIAIESLGAIPLRLMVRAGHPVAGKSGLSIADLQPYPVASATKFLMAGFTGRAGAFVCDNYHILRDLVLTTDCIWLSAVELVEEDIAQGRVSILELSDSAPVVSDISLITRQGRTLSPAARAIAHHVRAWLASGVEE